MEGRVVVVKEGKVAVVVVVVVLDGVGEGDGVIVFGVVVVGGNRVVIEGRTEGFFLPEKFFRRIFFIVRSLSDLEIGSTVRNTLGAFVTLFFKLFLKFFLALSLAGSFLVGKRR